MNFIYEHVTFKTINNCIYILIRQRYAPSFIFFQMTFIHKTDLIVAIFPRYKFHTIIIANHTVQQHREHRN